MSGRKITVIALVAALVVAAGAVFLLPRLLSNDPTSVASFVEMLSDGDRAQSTVLDPLPSTDGSIERVEVTLSRGEARGWRFPDGSFFWIERSDRAFSLELEGFALLESGRLRSGGELLPDDDSSAPLIVRGRRYSAIVQPPLARASEVVDGFKQPTLDGTNYIALNEFNGSCAYSEGALTVDCPGGGASDWWIYITPRDIAPDGFGWMTDCTLEKFGGDNRMTIDGYYYRTPADYTPSGEGCYFLNPAAYIAGKLARNTDNTDAHNLASAMLDIQRAHYNDHGFVPTYPTSNWLGSDYSVAAGFYDTRFNTELADALLALGRAEGIQPFVDDALRYAEFLNGHALAHSTDDGKGGIFVDDYWHPDGCERTHSSLNHQLAEALFLLKTEDTSYAETVERMIAAVRHSANDWIKPDGDLHYARYPDGSFGGADYPYLTYNDLLAVDRYIGGDRALGRLMDSKRGWMDSNGITDYNK